MCDVVYSSIGEIIGTDERDEKYCPLLTEPNKHDPCTNQVVDLVGYLALAVWSLLAVPPSSSSPITNHTFVRRTGMAPDGAKK